MLARPEPVAGARARRWADLRPRIVWGLVLAGLGLAGLFLGGAAWRALIGLGAAGLALEWWGLCRRLRGPGRWAATLAGLPYVGFASWALLWLRGVPRGGGGAVLFLLLVVWASDIGAYLAGRALGGPKLAPSISPGKTWAGAAGGLVAALLVACAFAAAGRTAAALVAALPLGVAAQAGDLLESAIKRGFRVKDSGTLIPGHGGLFDRLDGILTAAPVAALLARHCSHGVVFWQ